MDEQKKQPQNQVQIQGSVVKEVERPVSEYASEQSPNTEGIENFVKAEKDKPELDKTHEQYGIKPSLETNPIPSQPSPSFQLSIKQVQEARETLKANKDDLSGYLNQARVVVRQSDRIAEIEKELKQLKVA